jgi:Uma2 family endonuclease
MYVLWREELKRLKPPFLVRHYEADPEDYEHLTNEDIKCEYLDGELIVHSPASLNHESLTGFIVTLLTEFCARNALGHTFGSNAVMQIAERRFSPDVSVLLNANEHLVSGGRVLGPMDLVVEVISNSTRGYDHEQKLPAYREAHVGEIWLVDEERRQFEAHALRGDGYVSTVMGVGTWPSVVLPGLVLEVDWLWRRPRPSLRVCLPD